MQQGRYLYPFRKMLYQKILPVKGIIYPQKVLIALLSITLIYT